MLLAILDDDQYTHDNRQEKYALDRRASQQSMVAA